MRAAVFDGKELRVAEVDPGPLRARYARVRVRFAGICRTDTELARGYMGFRGIPGHEFVGEVVEGPAEWVGSRVVAEINFACRRCAWCAQGLGRHCPQRTVMGILGAPGAFAEFVDVPTENLHRVPSAVSDTQAVFVEPLAAAFEIAEQVHLKPGQEALVFGDGKLGLLVARVLKLFGANVHLVGKHEPKLALAESSGVSTAHLDDFVPRPYPLVVEATGRAEGLQQALECVRPRGTLVLKSTVASRLSVDLAPVVVNEVQVVGSRCGPFRPALEALARAWVQVDDLISARFRLAEAREAFAWAERPGMLKVLLEP